MFPFDIEDEKLGIEEEKEQPLTDYEIDFETGKLTGRIISGLDVIKQRVRIILGTNRYYYPQYSWDHGCELETLIGKNYDLDYIKTEAKRMVSEALMDEDYIDSITDFDAAVDGVRLTVSFTMNTIYGSTEVEQSV